MSDHYDRYNGMEELLSTNLASLGTDCISRQQAIDALNEYFARIGKLKRRGLTKGEKAISLDTVGAIKTLPPIQPKTTTMTVGRTKGEITMWYECDNCGEPVDQSDNYCRNCGRKFRKDG